MYKKASTRLRLLEALRYCLTNVARKNVYEMMVVPIVIYNYILNLYMRKTQVNKLHSLDARAKTNLKTNEMTNLVNRINFHTVCLVRKCLDGKTSPCFVNYFTTHKHAKKTRNNDLLVKIPRFKIEFVRSVFSMGGDIYNSLPIEIRQAEAFTDFRNKAKTFYM